MTNGIANGQEVTILLVDDVDSMGVERGKIMACLLIPSEVAVLLVSKGNPS